MSNSPYTCDTPRGIVPRARWISEISRIVQRCFARPWEFASRASHCFFTQFTPYSSASLSIPLPLPFTKKRYIGYDKVTTQVEMSSDVSSAERVRFKEDMPRRNRKTFTITAAAAAPRQRSHGSFAPGDGFERLASSFEYRAASNPKWCFETLRAERPNERENVYDNDNVRLSPHQL